MDDSHAARCAVEMRKLQTLIQALQCKQSGPGPEYSAVNTKQLLELPAFWESSVQRNGPVVTPPCSPQIITLR